MHENDRGQVGKKMVRETQETDKRFVRKGQIDPTNKITDAFEIENRI